MFTSGVRPWVKNVACLSSLIKHQDLRLVFNAFFPELGSLLRNTAAKRTAHEYDFELPVDKHFRLCIKIQFKQDKIQRNTQRTKPNFSFTSKSWAIILRSEHVEMKETSEKLLKIIITLSGTQLVLKQQDYHPISIISMALNMTEGV